MSGLTWDKFWKEETTTPPTATKKKASILPPPPVQFRDQVNARTTSAATTDGEAGLDNRLAEYNARRDKLRIRKRSQTIAEEICR